MARPAGSVASSGSGSGAPQTPSQTGQAGDENKHDEPPRQNTKEPKKNVEGPKDEKEPKKAKRVKEVKPQTPLTRGEDLAKQILKKKSEADELSLQLSTMAFGDGVKKEIDKFQTKFESFPQFSAFMLLLNQHVFCALSLN